MAFGRRNEEEIKTEETKIWCCTAEDCKGWIRDNFKSEEDPLCPLCQSEMESSTKVLQVVDNPHPSTK
ncbi:Zn finger protein HypA/HybF involved in hydrogenase expression [Bacillus pakistanensis]|uniref:Zn finger protein HypA/HybF involved in hydrogenase expression n=1 Tax=Rossellomorea pakistanensis TaxID=992288 RepID=A0ABS2N8B1_9BACI|nr:cold-inducible protein YdjO-related protein [Bacillus pakistanensis]MBM7584101.1 Zn finger protein HypA/HybF involved in hydrogenase expression [Bacillus pakistanensis]